MSDDFKGCAESIISTEMSALAEKMGNLSMLREELSAINSCNIKFQIVIPETSPEHFGAEVVGSGELVTLFEDTLALWNKNNPALQRKGYETIYVFVLIGEKRIPIPGKDVESITGFETATVNKNTLARTGPVWTMEPINWI